MMNRISLLDFVVAFHSEYKILLQNDHHMEVEVHYFVLKKVMLADKLLDKKHIHFLEQWNVRSQ